MMTAAVFLTAALAVAPTSEPEIHAGLELVYQGHVDTALARLRTLAGAHPADPLPAYALSLGIAGPEGEWRERARDSVSAPMSAERMLALALLGNARRRREDNRGGEAARLAAEALRLWPESTEAALAVIDDRLAHGDVAGARALWPRADARQAAETPWLRPWRWLLEAQNADLEGRREEAVQQYKKVLKESFRRPDFAHRAEAGLTGLSGPAEPRPAPKASRSFSTALSTT